LASEQLDFKPLSSGNIVVGNENASLKITIVTNPFCGHCQQAHDIIKKIIELHEDKIYVQFRFNHDSQSGNTDSENVHHKLVSIYYDNGATAFIKALHNWFDNKDETQLKVSEKSTITDLKIAEILKEQYLMNQSNVIAFTPAIFINQYQYPKMYDRKELLYFINDLLEDENFK
jgi:protein-disulfide isomerase